MKTLTLTSEFFQNECAESFCKAILGNHTLQAGQFIGVERPENKFVVRNLDYTGYYDPWGEITFKLDDSFSVDWACLLNHRQCINALGVVLRDNDFKVRAILNGMVELNLEYLATLQGVIIEEAGE